MRHQCLIGTAIAAILVCGQSALAQPTAIFQQSSTTGMIGFTTNQTARLNVLNLSPAILNTPVAANCTVQLRFFDAQNNLVKQSVVPNLAPGTAAYLDMDRSEVKTPTTQRAEIRGVLVLSPTPNLVNSLAVVGFCSVMITLEIVDNTTGSTVAFTADTRAAGVPVATPLATQ